MRKIGKRYLGDSRLLPHPVYFAGNILVYIPTNVLIITAKTGKNGDQDRGRPIIDEKSSCAQRWRTTIYKGKVFLLNPREVVDLAPNYIGSLIEQLRGFQFHKQALTTARQDSTPQSPVHNIYNVSQKKK